MGKPKNGNETFDKVLKATRERTPNAKERDDSIARKASQLTDRAAIKDTLKKRGNS